MSFRPPFPQAATPAAVVGPSIVSTGAPIDPGPPHPTLYLNNLNERIPIKKSLPHLSTLFTPFGPCRIIMKHRLAMRGQAWVIYGSSEEAKNALSALQGIKLWDKTLHIRFARFPTSINPQDVRVRKEYQAQRARDPRLTLKQRRLQLNAASPAALIASSASPMGSVTGDALQLPNKTLFIQQVPAGVDGAELNDIFKRFSGFEEVRVVPNRTDLAFVEFENEIGAAYARNAIDQQLLRPGMPPLRVTFAKR
jgi:RNA recognition motif-containing protein